MEYIYRVTSSTNNSFDEYEYHVPTIKTVKDLKKGKKIIFINPRTKQKKVFSIEFMKGNTQQVKLRNSHMTIVLKRIK